MPLPFRLRIKADQSFWNLSYRFALVQGAMELQSFKLHPCSYFKKSKYVLLGLIKVSMNSNHKRTLALMVVSSMSVLGHLSYEILFIWLPNQKNCFSWNAADGNGSSYCNRFNAGPQNNIKLSLGWVGATTYTTE